MAEITLAPSLPGVHRRFVAPLLLLGLFAVLAPAVGSALGAPLAGWAADHGHAGSTAVHPGHSHPYDHTSTAEGGTTDDGDFTLSQEGAGSASVAPAHDPTALPSAPSPVVMRILSEPGVLPSAFVSVPTPPPRAQVP